MPGNLWISCNFTKWFVRRRQNLINQYIRYLLAQMRRSLFNWTSWLHIGSTYDCFIIRRGLWSVTNSKGCMNEIFLHQKCMQALPFPIESSYARPMITILTHIQWASLIHPAYGGQGLLLLFTENRALPAGWLYSMGLKSDRSRGRKESCLGGTSQWSPRYVSNEITSQVV